MQPFLTFIPVRSPWFWLGTGLIAVLIRGLFLDVMDVDAAQYASISLEMIKNGSWLQVQHRGIDYLDKPPLLFWLSGASFLVFGVSNWAYKLPSLLGAFAGIWAIYQFCLLFYSPKTARQAAFMLASALGLMVICNDVRTDTLLLGFSTCAIWQLAAYLQQERWRNLLGAFICIGLAMLAKGPIGLVVPGFAVGIHLLLRGPWRAIFKWQWLAGLVVTALVLAPMCWGLWQQFDLHPEKVTNGRSGVSGLYFFFWEQSFGRVTGENVWRNNAPAYYFLHVYLWAFLPWCLLLPAGWIQLLRRFGGSLLTRNQRLNAALHMAPPEGYSLGAFTLTFIALSMSQYKLPHYIFITLPWAAVIVAGWLNVETDAPQRRRWAYIGLYFAMTCGLIIAFLLAGFVFPTANPLLWGILLGGTGWLLRRILLEPFPTDSDVLLQRGVFAGVLIGFVLNFYFYPKLLPFQAARPVAEFAKKQGIPANKMAYFHRGSHALDFYNGDMLEDLPSDLDVRNRAKQEGAYWLHTDAGGRRELESQGVPFEVVQDFRHFQVALLKPKFLNPTSRPNTLDTIYLLQILPNTK